eukprot:17917-Heterococcus_DN1.PRE.2
MLSALPLRRALKMHGLPRLVHCLQAFPSSLSHLRLFAEHQSHALCFVALRVGCCCCANAVVAWSSAAQWCSSKGRFVLIIAAGEHMHQHTQGAVSRREPERCNERVRFPPPRC